MVERDVPYRVWAARQTVRQHTEAPSPDRATGRCRRCTDDADAVCQGLREALHVLLDSDPATRRVRIVPPA